MNYGLKLRPYKKHQWVMGSGKATQKLGAEAGDINPSGVWPDESDKELQNKNGLETYNCTNFAINLALIALARFKKYGHFPYNTSERYTGIGTGTSPQGNDPWHVAETIATKLGAILEQDLPFSDDIDEWAKYYSPAINTPEFRALKAKGEQVLRKYEIEPEWVIPPGSVYTPEEKAHRLKAALKRGPVCVSVDAWHKDGQFYVKQGRDNHFVWLRRYKKNNPNIRDQYAPFDKLLVENYDFDAGILFFMRENPTGVLPKDKPLYIKLLSKLAQLYQQLLTLMQTPPPVAPEPPTEPSNRQVLYDTAYACLGKDMSPRENEFGCAESTYFVMKKAGVPGLPPTPIYSTAVFQHWLIANFKEVDTPEPGDVRIAATTGKNVGHMGIEGKNSVMSNNSETFKWDHHWSKDGWLSYYGKKGLKTRYFRYE